MIEKDKNNNDNGNNKKDSKGKIRKIIISILILLLLLSIGIGIGYFINKQNKEKDLEFEKQVDKIVEMSDEDMQAALNQIVEDGMINIQYQTGAVFDTKGRSKSFNVKNIENNKDSISFILYDEKDNIIYESKAIERGYEINDIQLEKPLSKGNHECKIQIGYVSKGNVKSTFPISIKVE